MADNVAITAGYATAFFATSATSATTLLSAAGASAFSPSIATAVTLFSSTSVAFSRTRLAIPTNTVQPANPSLLNTRRATTRRPTYSYRDINMLFSANPLTGDVATTQDQDDIKRAVINLVSTQHYERLWHPEIGCNATTLLFENMTTLTAHRLQSSITEVITNFEPRVTLQNVTVVAAPDQNGYLATIAFYVKNVAELVVLDYFLERVR